MGIFVIGMLLTFVGVAAERFHKTVASLAGAVVLIGIAVTIGLGGFGDYGYPYVYKILEHDLGVLGVIIGTGILVDITSKSGLFHFLGMLIVRSTRGEAGRLYFALCGLTFVFVALLTIVPAMLILSSLILVICRSLDYSPKPFLISSAICANSGAIVTFASGLPNIMIGSKAEIPYAHFLIVSAPYAVVSAIIAVIGLRLAFRHALPWKQSDEEKQALMEKIASFDPWAMVTSRKILYRSGIILAGTVIGFALAQPLGVGLDFVAIAGGVAALLFAMKSVEEAITKVNWTVILFFIGLFLVIGCVSQTGALTLAANQVVEISGSTPDNPKMLIVLLGIFSAVASAIVDNIPVAATLIPIIESIVASGFIAEPLWWVLILCCNLGGNGTPIGSISCVIALHALYKESGHHMGWGEFIKLGGTVMLIQVAGAIAFVLIYDAWGLFPALSHGATP